MAQEIELDSVLQDYEDQSISTWQFHNCLKNHRTVLLNETIYDSLFEKVLIPLLTFEKDDSEEPVTLVIQTLGGSVIDGLVLCNIIDNYKKKLNIIVLGYAFSMGIIILSAGNQNPNVTKYCYPFSIGLLHAGAVSLESCEAKTAVDVMRFNDRVDERIRDYIVKNTKITKEEYIENERKQMYLMSEELKEKGFIDHIIGDDVDDVL